MRGNYSGLLATCGGSLLLVAVGQPACGWLTYSNKESLRSAAGAEESRKEQIMNKYSVIQIGM